MTRLCREISLVIIREYGVREVLARISDPYWFQALGCVLGFDWHSSGVTTTVCGAFKEGLKGLGKETGLFVAGGKGGTSRKTPKELEAFGEAIGLDTTPHIYASRMSAKVDNTALQDGYQLYHHTFFLSADRSWAVVQQGMNETTHTARRYHWFSKTVKDFVCEPHAAICCDQSGKVLNLVAHESEKSRKVLPQIASEPPDQVVGELKKIQMLELPHRHWVDLEDIHPDRLHKVLLSTYNQQPKTFETLLGIPGVGPRTIRALALISELVYGAAASVRDPVRYSFAHGGKDGHPYPLDRKTYDQSIQHLHDAVRNARLGHSDKLDALKRLHLFYNTSSQGSMDL
jgi:hypothetical protein